MTVWWTPHWLMANRLLMYWGERVVFVLSLICDSSTLLWTNAQQSCQVHKRFITPLCSALYLSLWCSLQAAAERILCLRIFLKLWPKTSIMACCCFMQFSWSYLSDKSQDDVKFHKQWAHSIVVIKHTATVYSPFSNLTQSHTCECHCSMSLAHSKKAQSDTAISHSMAPPNSISSHVDCIRIGQPQTQLEARGYLSYPWIERWFRKSTWSGE